MQIFHLSKKKTFYEKKQRQIRIRVGNVKCVEYFIYLMHMLFHAQPIFVADVDATIPPFIIIGSLSRIE